MEIFPNSAPDDIDKGLGLIQALAKKGFEFLLDDKNVGFILHFPLVLLLAKQGGIFKEGDGKWHLILTFGLSDGKMVLILQKKVIVLQVSFSPIYV